jgi:hypothetical protein
LLQVHAGQRTDHSRGLPTFNWKSTGVVLRPHYNKIVCACAGDCGGRCTGAYGQLQRTTPLYCDDPSVDPAVWSPCVYRAGAPVGQMLHQTRYNDLYNELLISGAFLKEQVCCARPRTAAHAHIHSGSLGRFHTPRAIARPVRVHISSPIKHSRGPLAHALRHALAPAHPPSYCAPPQLPGSIEAFVGKDDHDERLYRRFLEQYGLQPVDVALVKLNVHDWENPFSPLF